LAGIFTGSIRAKAC